MLHVILGRLDHRVAGKNIARRAALPHIVDMANDQQPERPRVEPEILPPERADDPRRPTGIFVRVDQLGGVHRVVIARPGLPSIMFALVIIALVGALVLLALAGLFLFWIPILIIGLVAALLSRLSRRL